MINILNFFNKYLKVFLILLLSSNFALAYPNKPIELTVTFKAGSTADITGRLASEVAAKDLGQPIVVVNRLGGGGAIGFDHVGKQKNDGYNIGWLSASILTVTLLNSLPYDYKNWDYVCGVTLEPTAIAVLNNSKYKNLKDLIDAAKKNPGTIKIGHSGVGSFTFTTAAALMKKQGAEKVVYVPVGERNLASLIAGEVDAISVHPPEILGSLKSGDVKMLVLSSPQKNNTFPDVPTLKSMGMDLGFYQFRGIFVPKGTPKNVVEKLSKSYELASKDKKFQDTALNGGFDINFISHKDFPKYVEEQNEILRKVLNEIKDIK
jgi:tripartite-type tricarboxylate transporter receptor subunit TctC